MYETFEKLMNEKGVRPIDVARATGLSQSMLSDWKRGRATPKADKLQKIADYFGVPVTYLLNAPDEVPDDDGKEIARFLYKNPEYKTVFDKIRKVAPADIGLLDQLIDRMRK